jgi:hypothetical protein
MNPLRMNGYPPRCRPTTADLPAVDIYQPYRSGVLARGATRLVLTVGDVAATVSIAWELTTGYVIGIRPWFMCPACSARRRFLRVQGSRVACAPCLGATYRSRHVLKSSRPLRRALRLRRQIGAVEVLFGELPAGPRHARVTAEIKLCEAELVGFTARVYAALSRRKGPL